MENVTENCADYNDEVLWARQCGAFVALLVRNGLSKDLAGEFILQSREGLALPEDIYLSSAREEYGSFMRSITSLREKCVVPDPRGGFWACGSLEEAASVDSNASVLLSLVRSASWKAAEGYVRGRSSWKLIG